MGSAARSDRAATHRIRGAFDTFSRSGSPSSIPASRRNRALCSFGSIGGAKNRPNAVHASRQVPPGPQWPRLPATGNFKLARPPGVSVEPGFNVSSVNIQECALIYGRMPHGFAFQQVAVRLAILNRTRCHSRCPNRDRIEKTA